MLTRYAERARKGDYDYFLRPNIYVWCEDNIATTVFLGEKRTATGHTVGYTSEGAKQNKLALAAATRRQTERRTA